CRRCGWTGAGRAGRAGARRRRSGGCGLGFGLAESLLGLDFRLALGFLFDPVALFLGLAAGFGGFAFGLLDAFLARAALGLFLGDATFFDFTHLGVGQRAGARGALVLGQGAEHDAGTAARRSRCG